jgi:hypothetical protein
MDMLNECLSSVHILRLLDHSPSASIVVLSVDTFRVAIPLLWVLNQPQNRLPNAILTQCLTYIGLFDFKVNHVSGTKNGGADGVSWEGRVPDDK